MSPRWVLGLGLVVACGKPGDSPPKPPPPAAAGSDARAIANAPAPADAAPPAPALRLVGCKPAELPPRLARATPSDAGLGTLGAGGVGVGVSIGDLGGAQGAPGIGLRPGGDGGGIGVGLGRSNDVPTTAPTFALAAFQVQGQLAPEVVRRIVLRNKQRLYFCYQKELAAKPNIAGPVSLSFVIDKTGRVVSSQAAGVDDNVASCVAGTLRTLEFPIAQDGGIVQVCGAIRFAQEEIDRGRGHIVRPPPEAHIADATAWTPFAAAATVAPAEAARGVATAMQAAIESDLATASACLPTQLGSLRAIVKVSKDGAVVSTRAGGLGARAAEQCVEASLAKLHVAAPGAPVEVACDFERGNAQPWRVATDGGYVVLDVGATSIQRDGKVVAADKPLAGVDRSKTSFLLVVADDATNQSLASALQIAGESAATLVAARASSDAPTWLAMGRDGRAYDGDTPNARAAVIEARGDEPRACVGGKPVASLAALAEACGKSPCATITLGVDRAATLATLVAASRAARSAGFERLLVGVGVRCGGER